MCEEKSFDVKKLIDFDEFKKLCEGGTCLRRTLLSKNCMMLYKQQQCYLKYQKKMEKQFENQIDEEWEEVKRQVIERDNNECQLLKKLKKETKDLLHSKTIPSLVKVLDCAHYIRRNNLSLKYDISNICLLNRWSHSNLDIFKSPITGANITKEEWNWWWKFILGKERKKMFDEIK